MLRSDNNQAKAITNAMTMVMTGIYCVGVITRAMTIRLYAQRAMVTELLCNSPISSRDN